MQEVKTIQSNQPEKADNLEILRQRAFASSNFQNVNELEAVSERLRAETSESTSSASYHPRSPQDYMPFSMEFGGSDYMESVPASVASSDARSLRSSQSTSSLSDFDIHDGLSVDHWRKLMMQGTITDESQLITPTVDSLMSHFTVDTSNDQQHQEQLDHSLSYQGITFDEQISENDSSDCTNLLQDFDMLVSFGLNAFDTDRLQRHLDIHGTSAVLANTDEEIILSVLCMLIELSVKQKRALNFDEQLQRYEAARDLLHTIDFMAPAATDEDSVYQSDQIYQQLQNDGNDYIVGSILSDWPLLRPHRMAVDTCSSTFMSWSRLDEFPTLVAYMATTFAFLGFFAVTLEHRYRHEAGLHLDRARAYIELSRHIRSRFFNVPKFLQVTEVWIGINGLGLLCIDRESLFGLSLVHKIQIAQKIMSLLDPNPSNEEMIQKWSTLDERDVDGTCSVIDELIVEALKRWHDMPHVYTTTILFLGIKMSFLFQISMAATASLKIDVHGRDRHLATLAHVSRLKENVAKQVSDMLENSDIIRVVTATFYMFPVLLSAEVHSEMDITQRSESELQDILRMCQTNLYNLQKLSTCYRFMLDDHNVNVMRRLFARIGHLQGILRMRSSLPPGVE